MNEKQTEAINIVKKGKNLFLTGAAGTGKSYTLKEIVNYLEINNINFGLTALTGCASVLINGQTIHSFLCLGISNNLNEIKNNLLKFKGIYNKLIKLDTLIIDEISMMDNVLFELIDNILKWIKNNDKPFGNVQMILVGDFYQLPPINNNYCFTSELWTKLNLNNIILTDIIRQKDDNKLQQILQDIRNGDISDDTISILKSMSNTKFDNLDNIKPTRLYPINTNVDKINNYEYNKLLKINNFKEYEYKAYSNSNKNIDTYNIKLTLNVQIMVIRNIDLKNKLFNGTRGIVIELNDKSVKIKDINGNYHTIEYYTDINKNNKQKSEISFMPLKLAYAMSIHKSQGSTIDYLEIDIGDDIFISGQLYTALSRGININNIKILNFTKYSFMQNENIKKFYNKI